jgi:hypothetical protein
MHDEPPGALAHPGKAAYDAIADERAAVDLTTALPYNLDAMFAAIQARGIAARLAPFRPTIASLPVFDLGYLDRLPLYASALEFVHSEIVCHVAPVRRLPELANEGYALRTLLLGHADLLSLKGGFPADVLARVRRGTGYIDLIEDLNVLVVLYGQRPDASVGGSPVGPGDVERAHALARQMSEELGDEHAAVASHRQLLQERHKVAHLLLTATGQLRRVMAFLRFDEGDADALVPSLHVTAKRRRRSARSADPD